jgi:hypothetical protein
VPAALTGGVAARENAARRIRMPALSPDGLALNPGVYDGTRSRELVPDTLDLTDNARLAVHGILSTVDPEVLHTMWFSIALNRRTPWMRHGEPDTVNDSKTAESLPLVRLMSGSTELLDRELAQRREVLSRFDTEDGLYWNRYDPRYPWQYSYTEASDAIYAGRVQTTDLSNVAADGQMIRSLLLWRDLEQSERWDGVIRGLVAGLDRIVVNRDGYSFFPDGGFGSPFDYPRTGWIDTHEPMNETEGGEGTVVFYQAHQIYGLSRWYEASGDRAALDLARRLAAFVMLPRFWGGVVSSAGGLQHLPHIAAWAPSPPGIAGPELGHWYTHFHARAATIRALLEYGRVAHDERALEFCRRFYEYSWNYAIPRMGWMNHFPGSMDMCEPCGLGDIIALGIRLSDAGLGDYWDDVDAVARNQLVEQQFTRRDLMERAVDASKELAPAEVEGPPGRYHVGRDVIDRTLGLWGAVGRPTCIEDPWIMQCCSGNGTKGFYYAWEGILREDGDRAVVNLLLNRAGRTATVDSWLPYEGRVRVRSRGATRASIRIPWWVDRRSLRLTVEGRAREASWLGSWLEVDGLRPGAAAEVSFPVPESRTSATVCAGMPGKERVYRCTFRGSTLVDIGPRDENPANYPTYLRDHMRADAAPMVEKERFVPKRIARGW